jgi:SAM-dependent methyltransferase|tara:strand:- start:1191 stop:2438 length:1248 start_codon:yes stop_codon:yes gene_type:complete
MTMNFWERNNCRLCASVQLERVVEFPPTVAGEHLLKTPDEKQPELINIDLWQCQDCSHVQLLTIPNPKDLFNEHYTFMPGDNPKMINHFSTSIDFFLKKFNPSLSFAFEIGSNDGLYLDLLRERTGCSILGFDPALSAVKVAGAKGIDTIHGFFSAGSDELVLRDHKQPELIVANNVFAHIDDLRGVTKSISNLLKEDGYFMFEISYLKDVVEKYLIGTILHEHLSVHSIYSLVPFLNEFGLQLVALKHVDDVQGGAIVGIAKKTAKTIGNENINEVIDSEHKAGITSIDGMRQFNRRLKSKLSTFKKEILSSFAGKEIICFGAARSAPFIFQLLEIGDKMSFAIDDNPMKMGKFLPISNIPIYDSKYLKKFTHNSELSFLIAGWAQTERILKYLRSQFSGHAACIYPNFEIVEF